MKYVIESLAVIGIVAILAGVGFFTLCFMTATPSKKSVYPESNHARGAAMNTMDVLVDEVSRLDDEIIKLKNRVTELEDYKRIAEWDKQQAVWQAMGDDL